MSRDRILPGALGGIVLLVLLCTAGAFWMLDDDAPADAPSPPLAATPRENRPATPGEPEDPQTQERPATGEDTGDAPRSNEIEVGLPTPINPETYLPPPPAINPIPPREGEEGGSIPPAFVTPDLSGQSTQVHRDLELTLRLLHELLR